MVGRQHDGRQREQRVERGGHLGRPAAQPGRQRCGAEQGPAEVEARHGCVLIRDLVDGPGVERPERRVAGQGVHEVVLARGHCVEKPGRHQRPEDEPDQGQDGGEGQGVAPAGVVTGEAPVEVDHGSGRHDEVQRAVDVVHGDDERPAVQRPQLQRFLVVEADGLLPVHELTGVAEGDPGGALAQVPDGRVPLVEDERDEELAPPVQAPDGGLGGPRRPPPQQVRLLQTETVRLRPPTAKAGAPRRLTISVRA